MKRLTILLLFFAAIGITTATEGAPSVVIPGSLTSTEGDGFTSATGLFGGTAFTQLQQVSASELAAQGLTIGESITGVRVRQDGFRATAGPSADASWTTFTIILAQATNSIATMSTNFAANMTDAVTVFTGGYTLAADSLPGGAMPNAFGPAVSFTTPYVYQGGDLVFYYTHSALTGGSVVQDIAHTYSGAGTLYRSLFANSANATSGTLSNDLYIMQFDTVPEPTSLFLLALGGLMTLHCRIRQGISKLDG